MWVSVATAQMAAARSSTGSFSAAACEHLVKQRNIDTHRQSHITRAVLCDTQPAACVTEMLFSHELYWTEEVRTIDAAFYARLS